MMDLVFASPGSSVSRSDLTTLAREKARLSKWRRTCQAASVA